MKALLTDLYELNMAASYLRRGMAEDATFSLFVRHLPPGRGFLVAAGLALVAIFGSAKSLSRCRGRAVATAFARPAGTHAAIEVLTEQEAVA